MVNANLNQISIYLSQYLAAITFDIEFFNKIFRILFCRAQVSCHSYLVDQFKFYGEEIYFYLIFLSSYSPTPPCYSRPLYVKISTNIIDRVPINSKYQDCLYSQNFFLPIQAHRDCHTTQRACL